MVIIDLARRTLDDIEHVVPDDVDTVDLKMLLHSPPGHGKTKFIGSATDDPRCMPGLLADFEGGYATIRSRCVTIPLSELRSIVHPPTDKLTRVRITSWRDIDEIYDVIQQDDNPFKFAAFDSLTEIHYLSLDGVIAAAVKNKSSKDPDAADQQDYGKSLAQMRKFVRYFRDLERMHIVFTATTMDVEDARTRRGQARPNFYGKFANEAPALVDYVGYLGLKEGSAPAQRVLCTGPADRYIAKARNDEDRPQFNLPEFIEDPTMTKVLDALLGPVASGQTHP